MQKAKTPKQRLVKNITECTINIPNDILMYTLRVATLAGVTHSQAINVLLARDVVYSQASGEVKP